MRILIAKDKILDTQHHFIEEEGSYDIEKIGQPIIFNIREENGIKKCSVATTKKIAVNIDYDLAIQRVSGMDYYEVPEEKEIKTSKKHKVERPKKDRDLISNNSIVATGGMTPDEILEQESKNVENNAVLYGGKVIDVDILGYELSDKAKIARSMILEAEQVLKQKYPFYYAIIFRLTQRYIEDPRICSTLAVTPAWLLINTDFVIGRTKKELVFILAHEASHIILRHHARLGKKNLKIYNIATDLIINYSLCKDDFKIKNPKESPEGENGNFSVGGLWSEAITDDDNADSVYYEIMSALDNMSSPQNNGNSQDSNSQSNNSDSQNNGSNNSQSSSNSNGDSNGDSQNNEDLTVEQRIRNLIDNIKRRLEKPENAKVKSKIEKRLAKIENIL